MKTGEIVDELWAIAEGFDDLGDDAPEKKVIEAAAYRLKQLEALEKRLRRWRSLAYMSHNGQPCLTVDIMLGGLAETLKPKKGT